MFTRAREYQIDRVDVNYSPVRFGPQKRSRLIDLLDSPGESNARVSKPTQAQMLTEFLNPTGTKWVQSSRQF
jgi:hypothetical protein